MEKTKNATENIEFVPYPKAKTFILKPDHESKDFPNVAISNSSWGLKAPGTFPRCKCSLTSFA